jgi:3-phosphoglycerate kinase
MAKKGIEVLGDLKGKRVLVRVDFNVPLAGDGDTRSVGDDYRLQMALPTIKSLRSAGARVVLCSHLGRPKGSVKPELSLAPVATRLGELLGAPVAFCSQTVGEDAVAASRSLKDGELLLVENLRFHAGEKKADPEFGKALAELGDAYVNDAFGVCHRKHASVAILPELLPAATGSLIMREVNELTPLRLGDVPGPFVVVLGGAKLADKIPVLEALIPKVDAILVGGGMAYTFLAAMGKPIGRSRFDADTVEKAKEILEKAKARTIETGSQTLFLPSDHVVAQGLDDTSGYAVTEEIPDDLMALDIGPRTITEFTAVLATSKTVFWNGPMGVFEKKPFHLGTEYVASFLANRSETTRTIVGGGDSAAASRQLGVSDRMGWVSTGGGASLLYVQGNDLPGLNALPDA